MRFRIQTLGPRLRPVSGRGRDRGLLWLLLLLFLPAAWSNGERDVALTDATHAQIVEQLRRLASSNDARIVGCAELSKSLQAHLATAPKRTPAARTTWQERSTGLQARLSDCVVSLGKWQAQLARASSDLMRNRNAQRRDVDKLRYEQNRTHKAMMDFDRTLTVAREDATVYSGPKPELPVRDQRDDGRVQVIPTVGQDGAIEFHSDSPPVESAPDTQVFSWTPEGGGYFGDTLSIDGQHLGGLELWLGDHRFQPAVFGEPGGSRMVTKLPGTLQSGSLRIVRPADEAAFVLDANYTVSPRPVFHYYEHAAPGFSLSNAYMLATLSDRVYMRGDESAQEARDRLATTVQDWGMDLVTHLNANSVMSDTQGAVFSDDNMVIVVFRGTETKPDSAAMSLGIADWITDAAFVLTPPPEDWGEGVLLHFGFLSALQDIYPAALAAVQEHLGSGSPAGGGKRVWVTGHSLGGALASLFAYRLAHVDGVEVQGMVSFGSPRVGNTFWQTEFDELLSSRAYRWVNNTDPIPALPPHTPGVVPQLAYRHVGVRTNIEADGDIDVDADADIPTTNIQGAWTEHVQYTPRIYDKLHPSTKAVLPGP